MKLSDIYNNIKLILNKGDGFVSMDQLNLMLPSVQIELLRNKCEELFTITDAGVAIPKSTISTKSIDRLITSTSQLLTTSYIMVSDYLFWIGGNSSINSVIKPLEFITKQEYYTRKSDLLSKPIAENPILYVSGSLIYIYPYQNNRVDISYIKVPTNPFLDYYMTAQYKLSFLDVGESKVISGGAQYRDGSTSGTKVSETVELQLPVGFHQEFQDLLLEKISLSLDDQLRTQYSMQKQDKEDSR
jgi:hypothetical protein